MFLLLSLPPALLAAALLGGRISRVFEHPWRSVWLIWLSLGVQIPLFTARAEEALGRDAIGIIHIGTYIPLFVFLALNRNAGLGLVILGALANIVAIAANRGAMPVDPRAWQSAFPDKALGGGDQRNTSVTGDHVLQTLGDIMALPPGHWYSNAFSIGDLLLAIGLAYCFCRLSLSAPPLDRQALGQLVTGPERVGWRASWRDLAEYPTLCLAGAGVVAAAVVGGAVSPAIAEGALALEVGEAGLLGLLLMTIASFAVGQASLWSLLRVRAQALGATALSLLGAAAGLALLARADLPATVVGGVALFGLFLGMAMAALQREIVVLGLGAEGARAGLLVCIGAALVGVAFGVVALPSVGATVASGAQALAVGSLGVLATVGLGAGLARRAAATP